MFGLLFGFSNGTGLSVCESTDALYDFINSEVVPMVDEIEKKIKLWTAVYTNYRLVGWYAFGRDAEQIHLKFHNTIASFAKNPIFLLLNDQVDLESSSDRLPLSVFVEEVLQSGNRIFLDTSFVIETSQVEKIALDQVMKATPTVGLTSLEVQNKSILSSLNTLGKKVDVIVDYLEGVQTGRLMADQSLIRKAAKICQMLPAIDSDQFSQKFSEEINDSLMVTYLSAVTRTLHGLSQTTDHYTSLYGEKKGGGMSSSIMF